MTKLPVMFLTLSVVLLAALTGWQANTAQAQDDSGFMDRVSGSVGVDFTNEYYFRGIAQENQGFIAQPWAELGIALYENDNSGEVIDTIGLTFGVWNSIHDGPSGSSGAPNDAFYEFDAYVGVAVGLLDVWEVSGQYQVLNSPSNAFATTQEFSFGVAYDDSELLGDWAVSPYATVIIETDGGADEWEDIQPVVGCLLAESPFWVGRSRHYLELFVIEVLGLKALYRIGSAIRRRKESEQAAFRYECSHVPTLFLSHDGRHVPPPDSGCGFQHLSFLLVEKGYQREHLGE